jgi:hypothetical protein
VFVREAMGVIYLLDLLIFLITWGIRVQGYR